MSEPTSPAPAGGPEAPARHFDLVVIGSGSGNSVVDERFADRSVAIVEQGTFGGTCLNVGCIPTKMFVYPADLATSADHGPELGVQTRFDGVHWREVRDRIFGRIDPISQGGHDWRAQSEHVTLIESHVRFVDVRTLETAGGERIVGDQIVVAAGSRPVVPPIEGLEEVGYHTSDTVMRLDELPGRVLVVGGGYVAAEFAHVFGSFGSEVTMVNKSPGLLVAQDTEISERFTAAAQKRWDVHLEATVSRFERAGGAITAYLSDGAVVECDVVLVAAGRQSNGDGLDLARAGVETDEDDVIVVDAYQRTSAEGVWALGDVANQWQLKHVANHEARVVQHNLLHLDDPASMIKSRHDAVPSAVFTSPQIGTVGITEREAARRGLDYVVARQDYGDVAYGWAMEDDTGFAKVIAERTTGRILGGHLLGAQASNLIQPLITAMSFGQSAHEVATGQYWIHPALMEVVENLLLGLPAPS